ncbi:MAG TPA: family 20 glycosylhydrolase [Victivallales bacterium]|nr:family 20 glycosylhydrolase [Victivallales bacterium]
MNRLNVKKLFNNNLLFSVLPTLFSIKSTVKIEAEQSNCISGYSIKLKNSTYSVIHSDISYLMMALGDILTFGSASVTDNRQSKLEFRAVMLDCSRNAVPKIATLKEFLLKLSLMGLNYFCLYTEDTISVDFEPLIGYGRGAYTEQEIKELDSFCQQIGVTLFPCIQTLGHFEQILKFKKFENLQDNDRVLNVKKEKTYEFLDKYIDTVSSYFSTNIIHLGMDEPWGLGRGKSYNPRSKNTPSCLYAEHITKMSNLCKKKNLQPIIWGDYILGDSGENKLTEDEIGIIPKSVIMNYWNYGDTEQTNYISSLNKFKKNGYDAIASPGAWNWSRYWENFDSAQKTISACMSSAYECNINKSMLTMWGDDGNECLLINNYAILAFYLENTINNNSNNTRWQAKLKTICRTQFEEYELMSKIENPDFESLPNTELNLYISKMLFYDDPLLAYVTRLFNDNSPVEYYSTLSEEIISYIKNSNNCNLSNLKLATLYCKFTASKFEIVKNAMNAYLTEDKKRMKKIINDINDIKLTLSEFCLLYRKLWFEERKPFGFEVIDIRLGGLKTRLDTLEFKLKNYIETSENIEEFEFATCSDLKMIDLARYSKVCSMCKII